MPDPNLLTNQSIAAQGTIIGETTRIPLVNGTRSTENITQLIDQYQAAQASIDLLCFPIDRPKYYFEMVFSRYDRIDAMSVNATLDTGTVVCLPVPLGITDRHEVDWGEVEMGPWGGAIFNTAAPVINTIMKNSGKGATNVQGGADIIPSARDVIRSGAGIAASEILSSTPNSLSAPLKAGFGFSPNEFLTILLKGPTYKRFSFSWMLVPKNFQEAQKIRDIIWYINNAISPGLVLGEYIFSFPRVVRCAFWPNYKYLFRFKPAVITGLEVDYVPNGGIASFYHGLADSNADTTSQDEENPPDGVRLTLNFLELEYWLKNDFAGPNGFADTTRASDDQREADQVSAEDVQNIASGALKSLKTLKNQVGSKVTDIINSATSSTTDNNNQ